ncbi:hypothetical protein B0H11DRAFT_1950150 [Mycena galericulata]|nr:hypothetical protein B0H11DRAFT_1950150 [Mycena galericulata]
MDPATKLSHLPADVVLSIFLCCDICTVICVAQTCKSLHELAFSKTVWLALVGDLRRRCILDTSCTPNPQDLSLDELINLVKRLTFGPTTRSSLDSGFTPEVTREIVLHANIAPGRFLLLGNRIAKLLPSGRHVLFINRRNLECWHVLKERLVWTHSSTVEDAWVQSFAAEEMGGGDSVIIMICERTYPAIRDRENYIEIVDVNLSKGTHEVILIARAPDTDNHPFKYPVLSGSLAAVTTGSKGNQFLIIDWTQRSALVVQCHPRLPSPSRMELIPGHIVLTTFSIQNRSEIHLISTQTLRLHWIPATPPSGVGEFNFVPIDVIQKLSTIPGPDITMHANSDVSHSFDQISVWPNPLQDGAYRLWISESLWAAARDALLRCYQLSSSDGGHLQLSQRARYPAYRNDMSRSMTYSGHTLLMPWGQPGAMIISPTSGAEVGDVQLTHSGDHVHLSPFSGALTYVAETCVVVRYYK